MAVQKSRRSRATRGHRRSHDKLSPEAIVLDKETGELKRRHHMTPNGFFRGRRVLVPRAQAKAQASEANAG